DAVAHVLADPDNYGKRKRSGRPPKLTPRNKRAILNATNAGPTTARQILAHLDLNLKKKPALQNHHKDARLNFAQKHISWSDQWNSIIFSDEKKFNMDGPDGIHYYWHDLRSKPKTIMSRNFGGGSVMVWAGFSSSGKTSIAFLDGRQKASDYQRTLSDFILPVGSQLGGPQWIFQQDNAAIHTAKSTKTWFADHGVKVLDWPSLSPDLNPIENLWGIMVRRLYANGHQFKSIEELKTKICEIWSALELQQLRNLVESMPRRLLEVVKSKGGTT
ncbi:Transposable element Tc3 transposase-like protein, partial [Dinothrombium tinctorium]